MTDPRVHEAIRAHAPRANDLEAQHEARNNPPEGTGSAVVSGGSSRARANVPDVAAVMRDHGGYYGTPEDDFCDRCADPNGEAVPWPCPVYLVAQRVVELEADAWQHALANSGCVPKPAYDDLAVQFRVATREAERLAAESRSMTTARDVWESNARWLRGKLDELKRELEAEKTAYRIARRRVAELEAVVARVDGLRLMWDGDTATTFTADEIAAALHAALTLTHRNGEPT